MSGLRNMNLHHNNNVSRSMNSINDRREIEFETNLFVDFSNVILWAIFGIIVVAIFKKLHIKKSTNIILNAKFVVIEFWRNYLNKNTNFWEYHLPCRLLIQNLKYYSFLVFALKSINAFFWISFMHSTRNNSAIHIVIHVIV